MVYLFEEFRVPAKAAYYTTEGMLLWRGFHTQNEMRVFIKLTGNREVAVATTWPALATGVILVSQSSGRMIGPSFHRLGWAAVIDSAVLPLSGIITENYRTTLTYFL